MPTSIRALFLGVSAGRQSLKSTRRLMGRSSWIDERESWPSLLLAHQCSAPSEECARPGLAAVFDRFSVQPAILPRVEIGEILSILNRS